MSNQDPMGDQAIRGLRSAPLEDDAVVIARVYLGTEPESGPHPGFRGPIRVDALGVHLDEDCDWLYIAYGSAEWPDSEWEPIERPQLVPWHRVHSIEWGAEFAAAVPFCRSGAKAPSSSLETMSGVLSGDHERGDARD